MHRTQPFPILSLANVRRRPEPADDAQTAPPIEADPDRESAARQVGMSFQRTRMSADRTLMSVIRTSLSLITFGFTVFQVFKRLADSGTLHGSLAPRRFGVALAVLGIGMLAVGIVYHLRFMAELRGRRRAMRHDHLIHGESGFPVSLTVLVAFALLALGITAVLGMALKLPPFG